MKSTLERRKRKKVVFWWLEEEVRVVVVGMHSSGRPDNTPVEWNQRGRKNYALLFEVMTHRLPSLFLPKRRTPHSLSFLVLTLHLLVVPLCRQSFSGNDRSYRDILAASQHPICVPSPSLKSLPCSFRSACWLSSSKSCYQFTTPVKGRGRPTLTVKYPLFWSTRVTEKGQHWRDSEEKEKGIWILFFHPGVLVPTQSLTPIGLNGRTEKTSRTSLWGNWGSSIVDIATVMPSWARLT